MSKPRCRRCRSGLTLLELMVVLVILAIVATVAIGSLQPRVDNQRFQTATGLLKDVRDAIMGPQNKFQVDDTPLISGFVADMGRLPQPPNLGLESEPEAVLSELWNSQSALATDFPFQFRTGPSQPTDYSNVRLPCGWRGPYMLLPIGAQSVRDPWGRPLEMIADVNDQLQDIQISIPLSGDQEEPVVLTAHVSAGKVSVTGKVLVDNASETTIKVVLLIPDPETSLSILTVLDDEDEQADSFLFSNVPIGLRAIAVESGGKIKVKYIQVPHGGLNVVINLENQKPNSTP